MASEIHDGEWRATNAAFGGTTLDGAITVVSDDGIVASVATIHCGHIRSEEIAAQIVHEHNCHADLVEALAAVMAEWREGYGLRCETQVREALAKARGVSRPTKTEGEG